MRTTPSLRILWWLSLCWGLLGTAQTQAWLAPNETLIVSFQTAQSKTIALVMGPNNAYIQYRVMARGRVEWAYPPATPDSWKQFHCVSYFRPNSGQGDGMNLNYLSFTHQGWTYTLYDLYYEADEQNQIGLRTLDTRTQKATFLKAQTRSTRGQLSDINQQDHWECETGQVFEEE